MPAAVAAQTPPSSAYGLAYARRCSSGHIERTLVIPPSEAQSFTFSAPSEVPVDQIFTALNSIVDEKGLSHLQHHEGSNFLAGASSTQAAGELVAQVGVLLNNVAVSLEQQHPRPFCPAYKHPRHRFTGTMVLRIETSKAVPNVVYVARHRVMCQYRGMKRVCSRYGPGGHFGAACRTPRCNRSGIFGHGTEGCSSPCSWCGHSHDMSDCTLPRSYSALAPAASPPNPREPSTDIAASPGGTGNAPKPTPNHPQLSCK
ncbi:hypothetical protein HPB47_002731 [Ixodes persulcatus]|uniref:Uncharacterized protein n=1 Tax=Ixodes persulcatus TaxID=34615 RepID=A0AC60PM18_IXOPE|nr:hypothetical protein HPB47_002731 [Ixodes persulcatus]